MWDTLDYVDQALVRFAQRDLYREAARDQLARQVSKTRRRRSLLGTVTTVLSAIRIPSQHAE